MPPRAIAEALVKSVAFSLVGSPAGHVRSRYVFAASGQVAGITCECGRACLSRAELTRHHDLERMLVGGAP